MRTRALALAPLLAVLLVGCGRGNRIPTGVPGPTATQAKVQFIADLNAICKQQTNAALIRAAVRGPRRLAPFYTRYLSKLRALTPAPSQRALYTRFLSDTASALKDLRGGNGGAATHATIRTRHLALKLHAPACGLATPGDS
jgi:hypothetical protein